jgi:hypothetical protein
MPMKAMVPASGDGEEDSYGVKQWTTSSYA